MIEKPSKSHKTKRQEERRITLQKQYNNKEIGDLQFLKLMGALSFRCDKKSLQPRITSSEQVCPGSPVEDCRRYVSDELSSGELSGLAPPSPTRNPLPAALRTKSSKTKAKCTRSEKCLECKRGFQFW